MNLVSLAYIAVILVLVLEGVHRGFLRSALNLGAFFVSVITSFLFYPVMSSSVKNNPSMFDYLFYYTEGAEKIAHFEDTRLLVDGLSKTKLDEVLFASNMPEPFTSLVRQNVHTQAFAAEGSTTLGEYFNMTLVSAVLNIFSFLAVFLIARVIFAFVLGAVDYTIQFPELRQYNRTMGALFGFARGLLFCFLIATIVPAVFLIFPVDKIIEFYHSSDIGLFFINNNIFLHLILGIV